MASSTSAGPSLSDWIALGSIFITIWLALIALYRAESRSLIDKVESDVDKMLDLVGEFWLSQRPPYSSEELKYWTHRLSASGDRVDLWANTCAKQLHIASSRDLSDAIVLLIDAATKDMERHGSFGPANRKLRCERVMTASTKIFQVIESAFSHPLRKFFWW